MSGQSSIECKSFDRLAFEHYLRSGERLTGAEFRGRFERKFNPYHDELGRFTFAPGTVGMSDPPPAPKAPPAKAGTRRPAASPRTPAPRTRIAAMPGYPEDRRTAWRSSNDAAFVAAANFYNKKYGLKPGNKGYRTPEFLKAWAMRETGGEGNEREFRTDPFQVNNHGDWVPEKQTIAGLLERQQMTPAASAYSALEWLRYKAEIRRNRKVVGYMDDEAALRRYNGRSVVTRQSGGLPHKVWYARSILGMAHHSSSAGK